MVEKSHIVIMTATAAVDHEPLTLSMPFTQAGQSTIMTYVLMTSQALVQGEMRLSSSCPVLLEGSYALFPLIVLSLTVPPAVGTALTVPPAKGTAHN